jgi:DNA-binding PadR family transcriptional regulator
MSATHTITHSPAVLRLIGKGVHRRDMEQTFARDGGARVLAEAFARAGLSGAGQEYEVRILDSCRTDGRTPPLKPLRYDTSGVFLRIKPGDNTTGRIVLVSPKPGTAPRPRELFQALTGETPAPPPPLGGPHPAPVEETPEAVGLMLRAVQSVNAYAAWWDEPHLFANEVARLVGEELGEAQHPAAWSPLLSRLGVKGLLKSWTRGDGYALTDAGRAWLAAELPRAEEPLPPTTPDPIRRPPEEKPVNAKVKAAGPPPPQPPQPAPGSNGRPFPVPDPVDLTKPTPPAPAEPGPDPLAELEEKLGRVGRLIGELRQAKGMETQLRRNLEEEVRRHEAWRKNREEELAKVVARQKEIAAGLNLTGQIEALMSLM